MERNKGAFKILKWQQLFNHPSNFPLALGLINGNATMKVILKTVFSFIFLSICP